ncbi:MAG: hypothetical protein ACPHRO_08920 [Nannocystaceae bacterium]
MFARFVLGMSLSWGGYGCSSETSYDVFVRAQQLEGEAERSACKLVFDSSAGAHVISSDDVARCLRQNKLALAEYERAGALGFRGEAFDRAVLAARDRVARLESMVRTVTMLEREQAAEQRDAQRQRSTPAAITPPPTKSGTAATSAR